MPFGRETKTMLIAQQKLSILVVIHNEEDRLASCLERLQFANEVVVVLDRCTDRSEEIAKAHGARLLIGAWPIEGERRNADWPRARGWILVDADEHIPSALADEIRLTVSSSSYDRHLIPIDNYIGIRLVRHGWGSSFGTSGRYSLFRRGFKRWGMQRVHPALTWQGHPGPALHTPMVIMWIAIFLTRFSALIAIQQHALRICGTRSFRNMGECHGLLYHDFFVFISVVVATVRGALVS